MTASVIVALAVSTVVAIVTVFNRIAVVVWVTVIVGVARCPSIGRLTGIIASRVSAVTWVLLLLVLQRVTLHGFILV